ncbi:hypothetical protein V6S65_12985 [Lactococcus lactis]|nr:hypothetical protein [Lactococcus lactis]MDN6473908.1 hypothetical protein [Lactococcus lactis]MDN6548044.1 hypothetical protein [Lactococcus lactis]MDN6548052.1 hypothetical protein [Lactococcus lactis]MDN6756945.1 hypothetical protein [Lactococcus lactis]
MKAIYKNKTVDVWEISKNNEQPEWVRNAFKENYLCWYDDRLKILMNGIKPSAKSSLKLGVIGSVAGSLAGGLAGNNVYVMGDIGDYLDITNRKVVSKEKFLKKYSV